MRSRSAGALPARIRRVASLGPFSPVGRPLTARSRPACRAAGAPFGPGAVVDRDVLAPEPGQRQRQDRGADARAAGGDDRPRRDRRRPPRRRRAARPAPPACRRRRPAATRAGCARPACGRRAGPAAAPAPRRGSGRPSGRRPPAPSPLASAPRTCVEVARPGPASECGLELAVLGARASRPRPGGPRRSTSAGRRRARRPRSWPITRRAPPDPRRREDADGVVDHDGRVRRRRPAGARGRGEGLRRRQHVGQGGWRGR